MFIYFIPFIGFYTAGALVCCAFGYDWQIVCVITTLVVTAWYKLLSFVLVKLY